MESRRFSRVLHWRQSTISFCITIKKIRQTHRASSDWFLSCFHLDFVVLVTASHTLTHKLDLYRYTPLFYRQRYYRTQKWTEDMRQCTKRNIKIEKNIFNINPISQLQCRPHLVATKCILLREKWRKYCVHMSMKSTMSFCAFQRLSNSWHLCTDDEDVPYPFDRETCHNNVRNANQLDEYDRRR